MDDDSVRCSASRRRRVGSRRRARACRERRRPGALAPARRPRLAGVATVGRRSRDAQRAARDGMGRASSCRRSLPGFEEARGQTIAATAARALEAPTRSTCIATSCSRPAAPRGSSTTATAAQHRGRPTAAAAGRPPGRHSRDRYGPGADERTDCFTLAAVFWGTMPRFLARFSRDLELVAFEHAVARITSVPARRARLADRGELRPGGFADITLLDLEQLGDRGSFLEPEPAPGGIGWVFVNGEPVVSDPACTTRRRCPGGRCVRARRRSAGDRSRRAPRTRDRKSRARSAPPSNTQARRGIMRPHTSH